MQAEIKKNWKKLKQTPRLARLIDRKKRGVFARRKREKHEKVGTHAGGAFADCGGALADGGDSTGLDGMRAQAIYWSYPEALIEDYSEMTLNGRVYALILFRHEGKQKLQISYRDDEESEESDWTDWFTTDGALPQGERAQLETDGESVTISATDGKGVRQSVHLHMVYLYAEDVDWTAVL